jgi:hypothetical protein
MRLLGHVARMGYNRNIYKTATGYPEGRRLLGRLGRRWADNIKPDL